MRRKGSRKFRRPPLTADAELLQAMQAGNEQKLREKQALLEMNLAESSLPVRVINALESDEVLTVQDLLKCSKARLLGLKNVGGSTLQLLRQTMKQLGLTDELAETDWK